MNENDRYSRKYSNEKKVNKRNNLSLDWTKLTNKFKNETNKTLNNLDSFYAPKKQNISIISRNQEEISLINADKKKSKFATSRIGNNYPKIYNNIPTTNSYSIKKDNRKNSSNKSSNKNILNSYIINNRENEKRTIISLKKNIKSPSPKVKKKINPKINVEKALHSNLMSNDFENPKDTKKLIEKVKKGQKIYQYVVNDKFGVQKNNLKKSSNYYNKYINAKEHKKIKNNSLEKKKEANYVEQYHKKVNSNINNNHSNLYSSIKKENEASQKKNTHYRNKTDTINYDYVFYIYSELNNKKVNPFSRTVNPFHFKNQSIGHYTSHFDKDEEISLGKYDIDDDNNYTNQIKSKFNS